MSYLTSVINTYRLGGIIMLLLCCSCESPEDLSKEYPFPSDNPPSAQKIELGRALFFDKRLSLDESIACADCHNPSYAFTDRKAVSDGINGKHSERNAPTLLNSAFLKTVMFDAHLKTLELQVIVPIQEATEMGHNMKVLIPKLRAIPEYQKAAKTLFNRDFDAWVLTRSIAAFERSLISLNSPYDQFMRGNKQALTSDQRAGMKLFNTLYCTTCHPAPYFTNFNAENNGLYKFALASPVINISGIRIVFCLKDRKIRCFVMLKVIFLFCSLHCRLMFVISIYIGLVPYGT